jgi:hypothetical protein
MMGTALGVVLYNIRICSGSIGWGTCENKFIPETKYDENGNKIVKRRWEGSDVKGGFVDGYEVPQNMDRLKFPIQVTTLPNTKYMGASGMLMTLNKIEGDKERVMFEGDLPNGAYVTMPVLWKDVVKNTVIRNSKYFV